MKNGTCPKCNSENIYFRKPSGFKGGADFVFIGPVTRSFTEVFVCTDCGYIERYIANDSDLQKIKNKWTKVN